MKYPPIDVWRMSASRPWQLEKTHPNLLKYLKYKGEIRYHLIESVLQPGLSAECIKWAEHNDYQVYVIDPAKGQGEAVKYFLDEIVDCPYSLKMEDDFMPIVDIQLDNCILLMEQHSHINQICFNKRETMAWKWATKSDGSKYQWMKKQRFFDISDKEFIRRIPLVIKEKWWFGSALWRTSFIKPIFKAWERNTHNLFNHHVILPLANKDYDGKIAPTPEEIEKNIGCYIYGKTGDPAMVEHTGINDSLWTGDLQHRWKEEGKEVIGV